MKKIFLYLIISIYSLGIYAQNDLGIMSFNIRYDNPQDGINSWDNRKATVGDLIKKYSPDLVGVQEAMIHQVNFIKYALRAEDQFIGVGRDDGKTAGEFSGIFYSNRVEFLEGSTFWLSDTPEVPSKGWDAALPRVCTYGLFRHKESGNQFWVFNTHFDHVGKEARKRSAELILQKIKDLNHTGLPVVLMGDFNSTLYEPPIQIIIKEMFLPNTFEGPKTTFTGFEASQNIEQRIDFLFTQNFNVGTYRHLDNRKTEGFISDHLPVYCELSFIQK